jgi:sugar lactone lactonase YvrE
MNSSTPKLLPSALFLFVTLFLTACGGGSGGTDTNGATAAGTFTSTVSATVSGLSGSAVLQYNTNDTLPVSANGQFTVGSSFTIGKIYNFSISTQPTGQNCIVSPESVTVSNNNADNSLVVTCTNKMYNIGGTVSGLTVSPSVTLQDNKNINGDSLAVTNGVYTFAKQVAYNSAYSVSVTTPPTGGETCTVNNGSGTVPANDVSVTVACSLQAYTLGFTVTGLTGTSKVALQASNGDSQIVGNGYNSFANQVALGSRYGISVFTQPAGQNCTVANGTGTGTMTANVNVSITCVPAYTVGGTVSQLNGSMVLQNNATDNLTVSVNGPFTFPTAIVSGGSYNVSVLTQPIKQRCQVTTGAGNVAASNIGSVSISCVSPSQMGGAMQGIDLNLVPTVSTLASVASADGITSDGTNLYVVDSGNNMIRKIVIATGAVSTLAGTGATGAQDGAGATATFYWPEDITTDGANLYVTDYYNEKIRKIVIATGVVSSLTGAANTASAVGVADGAGATATFRGPTGITTDGTNLYVADYWNNKIRKIVIATGTVSSLTGATNTASAIGAADGAGATATFNSLSGITTDGTNLYVVEQSNNKIRKIVIATGVVSSLTGAANTAGATGAADGAGATATFYSPYGITTDGTNLYVADTFNNKIRKIVIATGVVSSLTGTTNTASALSATDGAGATATIYYAHGITSDGSNLYVTDGNKKIRKIQ